MYYSNEVITFLQANNTLSLKLDHALTDVVKTVSNQIDMIAAGAKRALFYTSCFTDEYQDVCQQQKTEDIRFRKAVFHLLQNGDVIYNMLRIYFEEIFKHKTSDQLEQIKKNLMAVNIHIAASSLTKSGFAFAAATCVANGMNLRLSVGVLTQRATGAAVTLAALYGVVQKAADSANRLRVTHPSYYAALYAQNLETMYFLVESVFERANAFRAQGETESGIAHIIAMMVK